MSRYTETPSATLFRDPSVSLKGHMKRKNQSRSQPVPELFDLTNIYRRSEAEKLHDSVVQRMRLVSLQVCLF